MTSEIDDIVSYFYHKYKGENSFKILMRIREHFVGISKDMIQSFINRNRETVCFYHVTYAFQSESTLYSCLNVKELLARSRREICQMQMHRTDTNTVQWKDVKLILLLSKKNLQKMKMEIYINMFLVALRLFHGTSFFED